MYNDEKLSPFRYKGVSVCCGLCYCSRKTRFIFCSSVWLIILTILGLILALLINAALVDEKFHLREISPDQSTRLEITPDLKRTWGEKLGKAISVQTISYGSDNKSLDALLELHEVLKADFPEVFTSEFVEVSIVNEYSLLLEVRGSTFTENPYLLLAHLDVVPPGNLSLWDLDPFLGKIVTQGDGDFIYGRGAIDDKHSVIGILQALEHILQDGGQPLRSFYIGLGHDEEVGGDEGAKLISEELLQRVEEKNQTIDFILDEGMFVMQDILPGQEDPVIYIGVVEKGLAMVTLEVDGDQHHSSFPPKESTIGILSQAIVNLEKHRHPAKLTEGPEYDTFSYLAASSTYVFKLVFSNLWLLSGLVSSILSSNSETDAVQRTTTAITIMKAGIKENVMPSRAEATVNHRIHPTSNLEEVLEHDRWAIGDDRVKIYARRYVPPPAISPYSDDSIPFQILANSALQVFPTGHIAPGTLMANTDTRHYLDFTSNIYRFSPAFITSNDTTRFHGINERISVNNFAQVVQFYHQVIRNSDQVMLDLSSKSDPSIMHEVEGSGDTDEFEGSGSGDGPNFKTTSNDYELTEF